MIKMRYLYLLMIFVVVIASLFYMNIQCKNRERSDRFYDTRTIFPDLVQRVLYQNVMNELNRSRALSVSNAWIPWPEPLANSKDNWKTIPLYGFGKWSKQSNHFPRLKAALASLLPEMKLATFSRLCPGTRLQPHHGWASHSNHVLRSHLLLTVPRNRGTCRLYVQDDNENPQYFTYQTCGEWITFDDSKEHWACNDDDKDDRIVLIIDMKRPPHIPKGMSTSPDSSELHDFIRINEV